MTSAFASATGAGPEAAVQPLELRAALSRYTTGVTVVTSVDEAGQWLGLTVNSFSALSLQPPLVLWSLRHVSSSLNSFIAARRFAVNVLSSRQAMVSHQFALPGTDRFASADWQLSARGLPVLVGCSAVFECELQTHQVAGDHELFIGRVLACQHQDLPPLVYAGGHYHRLGARLRLDGSEEDEL